MNGKKMRAAAYGAASLIVATLFGAHATGALAQNQAETSQVPQITLPAPQDEATTEPEIRFVPSEVVQEIPEEPEPAQVVANDAANLRAMVDQVMPVEGELSRQMQCLAKAVYFESRGEPLAGQLAVARVIMNRADSSVFPDDYCSVVTQRSQFSFVKRGRIPSPRVSSVAWERAKAIARIAHDDLWESEAQDALYFHATYVSPNWARHKSARAQIDSHIFYR